MSFCHWRRIFLSGKQGYVERHLTQHDRKRLGKGKRELISGSLSPCMREDFSFWKQEFEIFC